jgi:hypothetical protein
MYKKLLTFAQLIVLRFIIKKTKVTINIKFCMINLYVLGPISNTFTVPILALLMTRIITNDTQIQNIGLIFTTRKQFFASTWPSRQNIVHKCRNALLRTLPRTP